MKNAKEAPAILSAIYCINRTSEREDNDIDKHVGLRILAVIRSKHKPFNARLYRTNERKYYAAGNGYAGKRHSIQKYMEMKKK